MALKRPTGEALASELAAVTGHVFRDFSLMQRALTHSSARGKSYDNERLEFLGDRVLGLVVTEMLFKAYPDATQGELAVRLSALVSGAMCAEIAEQIGLLPLIHADSGVRQAKGKARNVRADAIEAVIAAIYLDAGLEAARTLHPALLGAALAGRGQGTARSQDRTAGMGAPGRAGVARLPDRWPGRSRPRSAVHRQRRGRGLSRRRAAPADRNARPNSRPPPQCFGAKASGPTKGTDSVSERRSNGRRIRASSP